MKRGEVWTLAGGGAYASKPRPVVILQDDAFSDTGSIVVCSFTSTLTEAPYLRVRVEPSAENGLQQVSDVMVDKIAAVRRERLGKRVGNLESTSLQRISVAILMLLRVARASSV